MSSGTLKQLFINESSPSAERPGCIAYEHMQTGAISSKVPTKKDERQIIEAWIARKEAAKEKVSEVREAEEILSLSHAERLSISVAPRLARKKKTERRGKEVEGEGVRDLPDGWKAIPSRSRPGKISYLNLRTKIVTQKHPSDIAAHRLEKDEEHDLPDGWKAIPSRSRPGKISYLNLRTKIVSQKHPSDIAAHRHKKDEASNNDAHLAIADSWLSRSGFRNPKASTPGAQERPPLASDPRLEATEQERDLPDGWKAIPSRSRPGKISYLNLQTKEVIQKHPLDIRNRSKKGDKKEKKIGSAREATAGGDRAGVDARARSRQRYHGRGGHRQGVTDTVGGAPQA